MLSFVIQHVLEEEFRSFAEVSLLVFAFVGLLAEELDDEGVHKFIGFTFFERLNGETGQLRVKQH